MAADAEQTYSDRIRVMAKMAKDKHELVNSSNWYRLMARHCYRNAIEKYRLKKYAQSLYWITRALLGFYRAAASIESAPHGGATPGSCGSIAGSSGA